MIDDDDVFGGYMNGWRAGMFHRCNGLDAKSFDNVSRTLYNEAYIDGYIDAYATHEARV